MFALDLRVAFVYSTLAQDDRLPYFYSNMGLFDLFRKPKAKAPPAVPMHLKQLAPVSYAIAYFVLPHNAFHDFDNLAATWADEAAPAGPVFYRMGCQFHRVEPMEEHAGLFRASHGQLDDATDYYLLEYPEPPPLDFSRLFPGKKLDDAEVPVLAPFFSAMLQNRQTGVVSYYVLGQSPVGGGATLRSVTRDGVNGNLGPGPAPRAEAFLECLRAAVRTAV